MSCVNLSKHDPGRDERRYTCPREESTRGQGDRDEGWLAVRRWGSGRGWPKKRVWKTTKRRPQITPEAGSMTSPKRPKKKEKKKPEPPSTVGTEKPRERRRRRNCLDVTDLASVHRHTHPRNTIQSRLRVPGKADARTIVSTRGSPGFWR